MADAETKSKKKKRYAPVPIGKDLQLTRTKKYQEALAKVYGPHLSLSTDAVYKGPSERVSHTCNLCNGVTVSMPKTMLNGSGCRRCRTTARHVQDMLNHKFELEVFRGLRETFTYLLDANPVTFNRSLKYYYRCGSCNAQAHARPGEIVKMDCPVCEERRRIKSRGPLYQRRLDLLYGGNIRQLGAFSMVQPVLHSCDRHIPTHTWFSLPNVLLMGHGCARCQQKVAVKAVEPFKISGKTFVTRSLLEKKALRQFKQFYDYRMGEMHTALSYVLPNVGKHVPAFYYRPTNTAFDVLKVEKLKLRAKTIYRTLKLYSTLGIHYRLAVFVSGKIEIRDPNNMVEIKKMREAEKALEEKKSAVDEPALQENAAKKDSKKPKLTDEEKRRKRLAYIFDSPEATRIYNEALKKQEEREWLNKQKREERAAKRKGKV